MNDGRADWNDSLADQWQANQSALAEVELEQRWWFRLLSLFLPEEVLYGILLH